MKDENEIPWFPMPKSFGFFKKLIVKILGKKHVACDGETVVTSYIYKGKVYLTSIKEK